MARREIVRALARIRDIIGRWRPTRSSLMESEGAGEKSHYASMLRIPREGGVRWLTRTMFTTITLRRWDGWSFRCLTRGFGPSRTYRPLRHRRLPGPMSWWNGWSLFQRKVWEQLTEIPFGETRSYAQVAAATGNPRAARAVGSANKRNQIPILIPCHRVVHADGSLGGYNSGIHIKKALLELEGVSLSA
jgi:O-6-methylguanine DNA methyltransferase